MEKIIISLSIVIWFTKRGETAFTRRVPYFVKKTTDEKFYWDDSDTRMKTMKEPNDRNIVRVSFDENVQEVIIGYSKCLKLTSNDNFFKIVSKSDGCDKFRYRNEILTVDDGPDKGDQMCMKANPEKEGHKIVRQSTCTNVKLYFEDVRELANGDYTDEPLETSPPNTPPPTIATALPSTTSTTLPPTTSTTLPPTTTTRTSTQATDLSTPQPSTTLTVDETSTAASTSKVFLPTTFESTTVKEETLFTVSSTTQELTASGSNDQTTTDVYTSTNKQSKTIHQCHQFQNRLPLIIRTQMEKVSHHLA